MERLGRKWGQVKLPKLGWVRFRWSRAPRGTVRSATLSRQGAYWFLSLLCEDGEHTPSQHQVPGSVGILLVHEEEEVNHQFSSSGLSMSGMGLPAPGRLSSSPRSRTFLTWMSIHDSKLAPGGLRSVTEQPPGVRNPDPILRHAFAELT